MTVRDLTRTGDPDRDLLVTIAAALIAKSKLETCVVLEPEDFERAEGFELMFDQLTGQDRMAVVQVVATDSDARETGR